MKEHYFIGPDADHPRLEVPASRLREAFRTATAGEHIYCRHGPGLVARVEALTPDHRPLYLTACGRYDTNPE